MTPSGRSRAADEHRRLLDHVDAADAAEELARVVEVAVLAEDAAHLLAVVVVLDVVGVLDDRERCGRQVVVEVVEQHGVEVTDVVGQRRRGRAVRDGRDRRCRDRGRLDHRRRGSGLERRGRRGRGRSRRRLERRRRGRGRRCHLDRCSLDRGHLDRGHLDRRGRGLDLGEADGLAGGGRGLHRHLHRDLHGLGQGDAVVAAVEAAEHEAAGLDHAGPEAQVRAGLGTGRGPGLERGDRPGHQPLDPGQRRGAGDLLAVDGHRRVALHQHGEAGGVRGERDEVGRLDGRGAQQQREAAHQLAALAAVGGDQLGLTEERGDRLGVGGADEQQHPPQAGEGAGTGAGTADDGVPLLGGVDGVGE